MHISDHYEYRVFRDGTGNVGARVGLFKLVFRIKFNNWWDKNASKIIEKYRA